MAGINTLHDVYNTHGDKFLKGLLNGYIIVNKNIRGSFFGIRKNERGEVTLEKKDGPITPIDRILTKFYEKPISHFEGGGGIRFADQMPNDFFIGMKYTRTDGERPKLQIAYAYNNKTKAYVHTRSELQMWADRLQIDGPSIYFEGTLDDDQKANILDFAYTPQDELAKRFRTESFFSHIMSILGNEEYDEEEDVECFVMRFYENPRQPAGRSVLAKVIDPVFYELAKDVEPQKPNDYIYLMLIDILNFIQSYRVSELSAVASKDAQPETNYINLINKVYKDFIREFAVKYMDIRLDIPEFMENDEFDVNTDAIEDHTVVDYINTHKNFKEIYKVLLNFFRRTRKKTVGLFDDDVLKIFNQTVAKINTIIKAKPTYEGLFPTFSEYETVFEEFNYIDPSDIRGSYKKMRGMKDVNVIIDYFQPVSMEHVNAAKALQKKNGLPCVFVVIHERIKSESRPFTHRLVKNVINSAMAKDPELFAGAVYVNGEDMETIINALYPEFQPELWAAGRSKARDYILQYDHAKHKNIKYNLKKNFKIVQVEIGPAKQAILNAIKAGDMSAFRQYTPRPVHSYLFTLQKELENK